MVAPLYDGGIMFGSTVRTTSAETIECFTELIGLKQDDRNMNSTCCNVLWKITELIMSLRLM